MKNVVVYIHGKGGNAAESENYRKYFPNRDIYGFDYKSTYPWDAIETINKFVEQTGARLTVMEGGEHWFHTEEQLEFLDKWMSEVSKWR